jgi:hypothetical protein
MQTITPEDLDTMPSNVVAHDSWRLITHLGREVFVFVDVTSTLNTSERASRALAGGFVAQHMGLDWRIGRFLGLEHYSRADGSAVTARMYTVVHRTNH